MTTVTWPTDIVAQVCDFRLQKNTTRFTSPITRSVQSLDRQGKRWMGMYRFTVGREKGKRIQALLDSGDEFLLWDMAHPFGLPFGENEDQTGIGTSEFADGGSPSITTIFSDGTRFGAANTNIVVRGGHDVGATTLDTRRWLQNGAALNAGDYIEVAGYLYMLTADAVADSLGRATLSLNRGLVTDVDGEEIVVRQRPRARMLLQDDDQNDRPIDPDQVWRFNLSFFEKLPA